VAGWLIQEDPGGDPDRRSRLLRIGPAPGVP